jgi:hypothetical protein
MTRPPLECGQLVGVVPDQRPNHIRNEVAHMAEIECIEHWKPVPSIPAYEVSNVGNIRSLRSGSFLKKQFSKKGYARVILAGRTVLVARIVLLAFSGASNGRLGDHKNRCRHDDKFSNLRYATHSENCRNRGPQKGKKIQVKGVYAGQKGGFVARIRLNGRLKWLGCFGTIPEAARAYAAAAKEAFGEFAP